MPGMGNTDRNGAHAEMAMGSSWLCRFNNNYS